MTNTTTTNAAITILYIEDDPASRMLVERTLRFHGYRIITAERGLEGIDAARREKPALILTDINLPDISGRELTTMLRADPVFADTPIVALTAQAFEGQRDMAMAAGLTGYLTKPIDIEKLPDSITHYLKGGRDAIESGRLADAQARYTHEVVAHLEKRIRELERANNDLRRFDALKDRFIAITAHELRTPLTLIIGYQRLVTENPALGYLLRDDPGLNALLQGMVGSVTRMQGIVNEIMTVSRIMTGRIELTLGSTDLGDVLRRAIARYAQAASDRQITLDLRRDGLPGRMYADWELLELTFANLISNAIKYTPDGGRITIDSLVEGDSVRVTIKDSGIGISLEDQAAIFDRFYTTSDPLLHSTSKTAFRGGGIGLGLPVAKGIVEAHGGRIVCKSARYDPDGLPGSEFIVHLPLVSMQARRTPVSST